MKPLLYRLRVYGDSEPQGRGGRLLCSEAADMIEALCAEVAEWQAAYYDLNKRDSALYSEYERLRLADSAEDGL